MKIAKILIVTLLLIICYRISQNIKEIKVVQKLNISQAQAHVADTSSKLLHHVKSIKVKHSVLLPQTGDAVHSVSFTNSSRGLIAVWFSGSSEAATDVKIWKSYYEYGKWTTPTVALDKNSFKHYLIRTIGNPVIYKQEDKLHLFVVVSMGGWALSRIAHFVSNNDGESWHDLGLLVLSPFFNFSSLVRNPIVSNGDVLYLPIYHECIKQYPEILSFDSDWHILDKFRINNAMGFLQPSLLNHNGNILGLVRNFNSNNDDILYELDQAQNYRLTPTNLHNFNSAIAVTKISDDQYLLVYNDGNDRNRLRVAFSKDMLSWKNLSDLEKTNNHQEEFSYPALLVEGNLVHVMYTYKRTNIKHVVMTLS